jgi:hypothetical protein
MKWVELFKALPVWRQVIYVVVVVAAFALLIWDIVDKGAQYTTLGVVVLALIGAAVLRAPVHRADV